MGTEASGRPPVAPSQSFTIGEGPANVVGTVQAVDADVDRLGSWQIKGGSGANKFEINRRTGRITIADPSSLDYVSSDSYTLIVTVGDGKLASHDEVVTINIPTRVRVCHDGQARYVSKAAVPSHLRHGDSIGRCIRAY